MENSLEQIILNAYNEDAPIKATIGKPGKAGRCILIGHIVEQSPEWSQTLKRIEETVKKGYSDAVTEDPEAALERSLQSANYAIAQVVKEHGKDWLKQFHFLAASFKNKQVHFSRVGKVHAFLVYNNSISDLAPLTYEDLENKNPLKTFSSIISGDLTKGSHLIFCTDSVLDYLSLERLKKTISESEIGKREDAFRTLLGKAPSQTPFGLLIVSRTGSTETKAKKITKKTYTSSLPEITIEETPLPSPEKPKTEQKATPKHVISESFTAPPLFPTGEQKISLFSNISAMWKKWVAYVKDLQRGSRKNSSRSVGYSRVKKQGKTSPLIIIKGSITALFLLLTRIIRTLLSFWKTTSKSTKILIGVALLLLILFIGNLGRTQQNKSEENNVQTFNQSLDTIQSFQDRASSALLYGDIKTARENLTKAQELTQALPTDTEEHQEKQQTLLTQIEIQTNKTRNLTTIEEPILIVDLQVADTAINPKRLVMVKDTLYTYNPATNALLTINPENKVATQIPTSAVSTGYFEDALAGDNSDVLLYHNNNGFVRFNTETQEYTTQTISLNSEDIVGSMEYYQNRLYRIDTSQNQIFRHRKNGDAFGTGTAWITSTPIPDLSLAQDIAIDGNIYVLLGSGQILEFFSGKETNITITNVDPWFSTPTRIVTSPEMKYLYVLDPGSKRIVILTKEGVMVNQYTSEKFTDLRDIAIDETNQKAYLLSGKKIYGITFILQ
ncbi:MAG: hypothetical protein HOJ15_02645 [Candidatus Jacksonbacteria bacterium]|jgi:hypothetical protein|nr:hypothetical protein [Candidatus Jacksonbacteria bacterium]MBT6034508.1 hypothetical protein [Candidatus Jacksonbacteria bacterium]MBT6301299.1 hypothetical protein [Candidatus Jacksonbacteria bacterium]MBT6756841.1 hypothetical protein [Candidatus Jacksonbacteria bacterium]MBT6955015.1 hypothetical protein [Candidatus Jacksonbacteria bacterium]